MYVDRSVSFLKTDTRKIIILPIGSCEQHGPHLPIDTDLRIARLLAEKLTQTFSNADTLLLPAIPFSCSWEHYGLGTLSLSTSTLSSILHDIAYSLKMWKIPVLLIIVNWHGGNEILGTLASEITAKEGIPTAVIPSISQVGKSWDESLITEAKDIHAGAVETSVIQAYWPDLIVEPIPKTAHFEPSISPVKAQAVLQALGSYAITQNGIWGAPEQANAEKGEKLITTLVRRMNEQIIGLMALVNKHN